MAVSSSSIMKGMRSTVRLTFGVAVIILLIFLTPIVLLFLAPFYIWRLILIIVVKLGYSDIDEIFLSQDVFYGTDTGCWYTRPDAALPVIMVLHGTVSIEKLRQDVLDKIIRRQRANGTLKYDKLQQFPVQLGGYFFWKWDREFSIHNHVKLVNGVQVSESTVCDFIARTARDPYVRNHPLWDITIVPNYDGDSTKSLMVLRLHHTCADGYSITKLIYTGFMGLPALPIELSQQPRKVKRTAWQGLKQSLQFIFGLPYIYLSEVLKPRDRNPLHDPKHVEATGEWIAAMTPQIPLKDFKEAKIRLSTPFTALLTSSLAGGIQAYFERNIVPAKIPEKMQFIYPSPRPGHPDDKLTNHWAMGTTSLTLNIKDIDERLSRARIEFQQLIKSPLAIVNFYLFKIFGTLPVCLAQVSTDFEGVTFVLSNFPGPPFPCGIFDHPASENMFWLPLVRGVTGINVSVLSYNGNVRIGLIADKAYFPDKESLEELCSDIYMEVKTVLAHDPTQRINSEKNVLSIV